MKSQAHEIVLWLAVFALSSICLSPATAADALGGLPVRESSSKAIDESKDQDEAVFVLVRHAEKESGGSDPVLTAVGKERAARLAKLTASMNLTSVYSTNYQRTRLTAQPVAKAAGVEVTPYNPRSLREFAKGLSASQGRHLIVGHSNTTPEMVRLLGGEAGTLIRDADEYDRLYIVTRLGDQVSTVLLRY